MSVKHTWRTAAMDYNVKVSQSSWISTLDNLHNLYGNCLDFTIGKSDAELTDSLVRRMLSRSLWETLSVEADNFLQRRIF